MKAYKHMWGRVGGAFLVTRFGPSCSSARPALTQRMALQDKRPSTKHRRPRGWLAKARAPPSLKAKTPPLDGASSSEILNPWYKWRHGYAWVGRWVGKGASGWAGGQVGGQAGGQASTWVGRRVGKWASG